MMPLVLSAGFGLPVVAQGSSVVGTRDARDVSTPAGGDLRVVSSEERGVVLELTVADFQVEAVEYEDQTYHRLSIPRMVQTDTPGEPQVPTRGTMLGIPSLEGVSVQVLEADYELLSGYRLPPGFQVEIAVASLDSLSGGDLRRTFAINRELYTTDAFYPGPLVEIGYTGYLRDQAVAQVQFYPVQYNPVTSEVRLYRRILARVTWDVTPSFNPGEGGMARSSLTTAGGRGAADAYERLLKSTILNYDALDRPVIAEQVGLPSKPMEGGEADFSFGLSLPPAVAGLQPSHKGLSFAKASPTATLKIGVTEDGLYELTYSDLISAGLDLDSVDPRTIKITNRGVELRIYIQGQDDGVFDPEDVVLFYGTAITDVYTVRNVYWLTAGGGAGRRMLARDGTLSGGASVPRDFPVTLHAEEDTDYWLMPGGDSQEDHWFWGERISPATGGLPTFRDYSLTLDNISTEASTATMRVRLKGYTSLNHRTRVYLNGHQVDDQSWSGQIIFDHQITVPHSYLQDGVNTVRVEAADSGDALPHQVLVNWIELTYMDTYVAESDELLFGAPTTDTFQFEVTNFITDDVQVFDVTDPINVAVITGTTVMTDGGGYQVQFEDTAGPETRYLAITSARRKSPASIEQDRPSSWGTSANGADYIIITHDEFYTPSLRLAGHRSITSGLRVALVMIEDVYDEFNYGISNPQAIRDFLSYAYHNWVAPAPTYVLLISGATYDYRDLRHLGRANYVPTHLTVTPILGETPSDNWFVAVNGDDLLPDMFVGRLAAQNSAEADDMVDKIIHYEEHPPDPSWNTNVLLVADDDEASFEDMSETIAARLPYYYTVNRIYLAGYSGDPTEGILDHINDGSLLVNYAGHGNLDRWAQENVFNLGAISSLENTDRPPVVTVANCLNAFFIGSSISMAEKFMQRPDRGAVAVWADTSLDYPYGHEALLREFYDAIFQDDQYGLGDATTMAKIAAYSQNSLWGELVETFVLFGDPAMQLGIPTNYPYVESTTPVNGARDVSLDQDIHIVFSKPMDPATVSLEGPGTAGLSLTPTWSANNTVLNYTHTGFDYNQVLTFTISGQDGLGNPLGPGPIPGTWSFTTPFAPGEVDIGGPTTGVIQVSYAFSAAVAPSLAAQPLTYVWQATDQSPVTHTGRGLDDEVSFNWVTPGTKTVTVTVSNLAGAATQVHQIILDYSSPTGLQVIGPAKGTINTVHTFTATVNPITATQPITYIWRATNQELVTHTGLGLVDGVTFTWDVTGTQIITVTASNAGGSAENFHLVTINDESGAMVYLPLVVREVSQGFTSRTTSRGSIGARERTFVP